MMTVPLPVMFKSLEIVPKSLTLYVPSNTTIWPFLANSRARAIVATGLSNDPSFVSLPCGDT